jgi:hypothetical protein
MSYDNQDKIDLLWKRYKGVTPTSSTKSAQNESLTSIQPTFQQNFWTDSDRIPVPAPTITTPVGNELWFGIITPRRGSLAVEMIADPTTDLTAFHAMYNPTTGIAEENRIRNWVPPTINPSYSIAVYAGNPNGTQGAVRLTQLAENQEWEFDYATGVLFFPNGVPEIVEQNGIWIEGWVYTGEIGRSGQTGNSNTSKIRTLTFTSGLMAPGASVDFTFETGGKCTLVEAKVTVESTLECHSVSSRTDTNPYRFIAVPSHLVDDGSYVIGGTRYFGERFVQLINMEDTTSSETYWRLTNNSATTQTITVIIRVA